MTVPGPPSEVVEAPKRPDSVKLAVELWCAAVVALSVNMVAQYSEVRHLMQEQVERMGQTGDVNLTAQTILALVIGVGVLVVVSGVILKFLWDGRNWARQVLGVFAAFFAVQLVFVAIGMFMTSDQPQTGPSTPAWATAFYILAGVAAIGVLYALMHRDTTIFCRDSAAWRTRNRQNGIR